jgi:GNAT superfamily N-acetyltransferase
MPDNSKLDFKLIGVESPFFREAMEIYHSSFPSNERQEVQVLKNRIKEGNCRLIACLKEGQVLAFAVVWEFSGIRFDFLDYFAVRPDFRDRGIGRQLLGNIRNQVLKKNRILMIEAENPEFGEGKTDKLRRISFYEKAGARWMAGIPYILPALDGTENTPMSILAIADNSLLTLPGNEFKSLVLRIFRDVYQRSSSDPVLNSFIHQIPQIVCLKAYFHGKS